MKSAVLRGALAVVAGLVAAGLLVFAIELLSTTAYPPPEGLHPADRGALADHVATLPPGAFTLVLVAWTFGAFVGVWIATRIARSWIAGLVVGLLFLGGSIANLLAIPHPPWFPWAAIVLVVGSAAVALRLGSGAPRLSPPP